MLLAPLFRRCRRAVAAGEGYGLHLAPDIPVPLLIRATESYLDLREDEVLLGIVGRDAGGRADAGLRRDDPSDLLAGTGVMVHRWAAAALPMAGVCLAAGVDRR